MIVQGKIIDELGNPLPGAHIVASGNNGTTSDFNGFFQLEANELDTLKISFLGFSSKVYKALNMPRTIQLDANNNQLPEVVIHSKRSKEPFYKAVGFKIALATIFLGGLLLGNPKKEVSGLKGFAKVEL